MAGEGDAAPLAASPRAKLEDDAEVNGAIDESQDRPTQPDTSQPPISTSDTAPIGGNDGADDVMPPEISAAEAEARIPQKKDATLREFLGKMDDYAPIIPDAVTNYYLTLAGLPPPPQTPPHLARLLALATQKFVADVAADAYQYARIRSTHTTSNTATAMMGVSMGLPGQPIPGAPGAGGSKDNEKSKATVGLGMQRPGYGGGGQGGGQGRTVLTMEDLGMAVGEYGVNVKRGEFYR